MKCSLFARILFTLSLVSSYQWHPWDSSLKKEAAGIETPNWFDKAKRRQARYEAAKKAGTWHKTEVRVAGQTGEAVRQNDDWDGITNHLDVAALVGEEGRGQEEEVAGEEGRISGFVNHPDIDIGTNFMDLVLAAKAAARAQEPPSGATVGLSTSEAPPGLLPGNNTVGPFAVRPLPPDAVAMYVLSTITQVRQRVLSGHLASGWPVPLGRAGRFFVVVEDGPPVRDWLAESGCTMVYDDSGLSGFSSSGSDEADWLDAPALRGEALCLPRRVKMRDHKQGVRGHWLHGFSVVLTSCQPVHWGTKGPCCKVCTPSPGKPTLLGR
jgi:hypothetical protein